MSKTDNIRKYLTVFVNVWSIFVTPSHVHTCLLVAVGLLRFWVFVRHAFLKKTEFVIFHLLLICGQYVVSLYSLLGLCIVLWGFV